MISQITRSKVIKCVRGLPVLDLLRRCLDRGPASSFCISAVAAAPANAPTAMSETISSRSQPYSSPVILLSPHSRPYANLGSMPSGRPLPIWAGPEPACMRAVGNTRSAILEALARVLPRINTENVGGFASSHQHPQPCHPGRVYKTSWAGTGMHRVSACQDREFRVSALHVILRVAIFTLCPCQCLHLQQTRNCSRSLPTTSPQACGLSGLH